MIWGQALAEVTWEAGREKKGSECHKPQMRNKSVPWRASRAAFKDCRLPNLGHSLHCFQAVSAVV